MAKGIIFLVNRELPHYSVGGDFLQDFQAEAHSCLIHFHFSLREESSNRRAMVKIMDTEVRREESSKWRGVLVKN